MNASLSRLLSVARSSPWRLKCEVVEPHRCADAISNGMYSSEILLRRSRNSASKHGTGDGLVDIVERIHDALHPGFIYLPLISRERRERDTIGMLTSVINCLTASSVC